MARAVWTPLAASELEDILFYIRVVDGRPETSRRVGEAFRECVEQVSLPCAVRHKHPDAPADWFYVRLKRWLIFYRQIPGRIEVMRVVDAARDLPTALT
jgi:plasmid stabilization system protein ParE